MKRKMLAGVVCCLSLGLNVALLLPHAGRDAALAGSPLGNGDVNGSGAIDIADAVYLLSYLFAQGPAPVAIESAACDSCCPPVCPPQRLPATGQTACYGVVDEFWVTVPCEEAEIAGQDGAYQAGCPTAGRFVDHGDGTVTDTCTGLMWQKDTADVNGDGMIDGGQDALTWWDALAYCEGLDFAGYTDWRLPNVWELQSIVDYGRGWPELSIDPVFGAVSSWYWSSSTYVVVPDYAWSVSFFSATSTTTIRRFASMCAPYAADHDHLMICVIGSFSYPAERSETGSNLEIPATLSELAHRER